MSAAPSMDVVPSEGRALCGARRKRGGAPCKRPAGAGTAHPGYGRCRIHGGMTPSHVKAAAKEAGQALMRVDVQELDVDPMTVMLYTVRRFSALASCYRGQMAAVPMGDQAWGFWRELEREALNDAKAAAQSAVTAGRAERQVRIAERMGQRISAAFEYGVDGLDLEPAPRAKALERFINRLELLEQTDE